MNSLLLTTLLVTILIIKLNAVCDNVYTIGDDELCTVSLSTFSEDCITFNASYDIAATNGLSINPFSTDLYMLASIGSNNGDRELFVLEDGISPDSPVSIAVYTSSYEKLAGMSFTCDNTLYGLTGSQSDHNLFSVSITDGSLTVLANLTYSSKGTGIAYSPYDDKIYRVAGTTQLDIEQIDYTTGIITSDYYVTEDGIQQLRALGYYRDNFLFLIDTNERLFELDISSGDVTHLHNLTSSRKHKGIICTDYDTICAQVITTTATPIEDNPTTTVTPIENNPTTTVTPSEDIGYKLYSFFNIIFVCILVIYRL